VLLNGARQTGKSTLVKSLAKKEYRASYVTFDDATALSAAAKDPAGFLSGFEGPLILDEIQRAPELFSAIKAEVDRSRRPGRFLLTGSANVLLLPNLSESLAGRMEIITLWPLSQGEIASVKERFVDSIFDRDFKCSAQNPMDRNDILNRAIVGSFPEVISRRSSSRRKAWFRSYVTTITQRDIRDIASIEHLTEIPRLLSLLASRSGSLLNYAEISRSLGIPQTTLKRYISLLQMTFLVQMTSPWSANLGKRLVRSPKVFLADSGLMASILGFEDGGNAPSGELVGQLIENFVITELYKQITWSEVKPTLFHFRTSAGHEVDAILENSRGEIVGIEVKASKTVTARDFRGLELLDASLGKRFLRGIVLYTGQEPIHFRPNLSALPISALWTA
jgi:hypothetical protein